MDESYRVRRDSEIATPALLVYREKLAANTAAALEVAGGPGRLRPHIKTHKCPRVIELMMAQGIIRFKCATIAEAEMLARGYRVPVGGPW